MKPTSLPLTRSGAALKTLRPSTLRGSSPRMGSVPPSSSRCTGDRKSTRLNSSHLVISYAVFCLKKKKKQLLLLVYELNLSGLLGENDQIRHILTQLDELLICDLSLLSNVSVTKCIV